MSHLVPLIYFISDSELNQPTIEYKEASNSQPPHTYFRSLNSIANSGLQAIVLAIIVLGFLFSVAHCYTDPPYPTTNKHLEFIA